MCKNIIQRCFLWTVVIWNIMKPYFKTFVFKYLVLIDLYVLCLFYAERKETLFFTARTLCFIVISYRKQSGKQNLFDQSLDVFIAMTFPNISLQLFSTLMYMLSSIVCVFSFDRSIMCMYYSSVVTDEHRFFLMYMLLFSDQKRFSTFVMKNKIL